MLVLLEKRGLVAREQHPTDGRARSVTLTRKGRQALERLWTGSEPLRERITAVLEPEETDLLADLLARVCQAMMPTKRRTRPRSKAASAARR